MTYVLQAPKVVSRNEWNNARKELLAKEKELTRARDRLNAERRQLPMVRLEKEYTLEGPGGQVKLRDLFAGRDQLIVHHLMFHPDHERACSSCSFGAGGISFAHRQLRQGNATLIAVSRAPYKKLAAMSEQMGWKFPWYSSFASDFNYDLDVTRDAGEVPALSVFLKMEDDIYQTYWTSARGLESYSTGFNYVDATPLGRQEKWEEPKGRAKPMNLQAGSTGIKYEDEWI